MSTNQADPYVRRRTASSKAIFAGGVLLFAMLGFAFGSGRGLNGLFALFGGPQQDPTLIGAKRPAPRIQAVAEATRPATQLGFQPSGPTIQTADKMPAEVRAWLRHLEETEARRRRLSSGHLASVMTLVTGASLSSIKGLIAEGQGEETVEATESPELANVEGFSTKARSEWRELDSFFNSKQPPVECLMIKNSYQQCLGETGSMISEIIGAISASRTDQQSAIDRLTQMMGTSQGRIDKAARQSDDQVKEVCDRYETIKWFNLASDFGSGLSGLVGLPLGL